MAMGEPSLKEKVFCCNCEYLWGEIECHHPKNRRCGEDTWFEPGPCLPYKHPSKINKKNNCSWFSKRKSRMPNF